MARALIIGIGHPDRGDDAVGPAVADRLRAQGAEACADVLVMAGEGTSLMEAWADRARVIIVDAARSGRPPGTVRRLDAATEDLLPGVFRCSTHAFGLAEAVETARALGRLPGSLVVYAIEGSDFSHAAPMTPLVVSAVNESVARILAELLSDSASAEYTLSV